MTGQTFSHITIRFKMNSLSNNFNLPDINDFKKGGKFYKIKNFSSKKKMPDELIEYIYPQEFKEAIFSPKMRNKFNSNKYQKLKNYCLQLKKRAIAEEKELLIKQAKDFEKRQMEDYFTKQLEEKIKEYYNSYYKNLYQNCNCNKMKK